MASSVGKFVPWSGELSWVMWLQFHGFVVVVCLLQLTVLEGADADTIPTTDTVTSLPSNDTAIQNITARPEGHTEEINTGTVVAVSIICILLCITIIVAVYFFRRKRQFRMMDKEKKMQIQMSSARNAGVYQDLTVSVPGDEKPAASPEHERLKAAEDV
ncbi:unnamed protein product [Candidula unifasciata]|uniref:Uncharacterized protein n=1 Tax=Candidula unifasciata TaxID=100452 RepID=A0A8S3YHT2_9EUPU|nr:unnamed protein product [Candidula unifasciata]